MYTYEDFFEIEKIRIGLNIKYGAIINLTPHLNIEFYTGIGLAFRNSVHYDRDYPEDELYDPVLSHSHQEGQTWMPTFPIGMKFGYKF